MNEAVLTAPKWKSRCLAILGTILAIPPVAALFGAGSVKPASVSAIVGGCCFVGAYCVSGSRLRIHSEGFEVRNRFSAPRYLHWHEVDEIGLAAVPRWSRAQKSYDYFAGVRLAEGSLRRSSSECVANRALCGFDVLLADIYGMPLDQFIAFLKGQKANAKSG